MKFKGLWLLSMSLLAGSIYATDPGSKLRNEIKNISSDKRKLFINYARTGDQGAFMGIAEGAANFGEVDQAGYVIGIKDDAGNNLLRIAVRNGHERLVKYMTELLQALPPEIKNYILNTKVRHYTTLISAIMNTNDPRILYWLLRAGADPNILVGEDEQSNALIGAIKQGKQEMVALLLYYDADPLSKNGAPLIHAIRTGNNKIIQLINDVIAPKAWRNTKDPVTGNTALVLAKQNNLGSVIYQVQDLKQYLQQRVGIVPQ